MLTGSLRFSREGSHVVIRHGRSPGIASRRIRCVRCPSSYHRYDSFRCVEISSEGRDVVRGCTSITNGVGACWHVVIYSRRVHQCVSRTGSRRRRRRPGSRPDMEYYCLPGRCIVWYPLSRRQRKEGILFHSLGGRPMFLKHHFRWSCLGCANPSGWVVLFKRGDLTRIIWRPWPKCGCWRDTNPSDILGLKNPTIWVSENKGFATELCPIARVAICTVCRMLF